MKRVFIALVCLMAALTIHAERYVVTANSFLNVRSAAEKSAPAIGKVYSGDTLDIKSVEGEWASITYKGTDGYVSSNYIKPVREDNTSVQAEKKEESYLLTKIAYGAIVCFSIACFAFKSIRREEGPNDKDLKQTILYFTLLSLSLILSYFFCDIELVVNNQWTGGWLNGYFLAFINSCVMTLATAQVFRSYQTIAYDVARQFAGLDDEQLKKLHVNTYLFLAPFTVVCALLSVLFAPIIFIPIAVFIFVTYKNYKLVKPNLWLPLVIMLLGFYTCFVMGVAILVFIKMLVFGVLAIVLFLGFMKALPSAVSEAVKESNRQEARSQQQESNQAEDEFTNVLKDGYGNEVETKDYDWSGTQIDKWGTQYEKQEDGSYKKKI